jgi:copper chaperone
MLTLNIPAISCGHCVRAVTEAVQEIDPDATVEVDIAKKQARVTSDAETGQLLHKLAEEGYPATAAA